jgi:sec-independent protein translocase protein TatA
VGSIGFPEILIAVLVLFFLFGAKRIPGIFRAVGESIKIFKHGLNDKNEQKKEE